MNYKEIILDFDETYKYRNPGDGLIVLSSSYENEWTINVKAFRENLSEDVIEYKKEWQHFISNATPEWKQTLRANESMFFKCVIGPLSRWIEAIEAIIKQHPIETISFTTLCENKYIFTYEAEGETNTQFLYKKDYYLSFYLQEFLQNKSIPIRSLKRRSKLYVNGLYFLRNALLLFFISSKQLLFRILTWRRNYNSTNHNTSVKYIISSRAIVQTEFIQQFVSLHSEETLLLINEQSFRPFKHLRFAQKTNLRFFYAEGYLQLTDWGKIVGGLIRRVLNIRTQNETGFSYKGIHFDARFFIHDLFFRELDYLFYAESIKNAIQRVEVKGQHSTLVSFEMFTPYSFYLDKGIFKKAVQIQTTLIEPVPYPNFISGDKFIFTNTVSYHEFKVANPDFDKIDCIPFLKYIGATKKQMSNDLKKIVYFTQPIDYAEELLIIDFLDNFCFNHQIELTIKPHPRQLVEYNKFKKRNKIASPQEDIKALLLQSDIMITRSSSLGLDAWIYGTPCVFVKLNNHLQKQNIFYAPNNYLGSVMSIDGLENILANYDNLKKEFAEYLLYKETIVNNINLSSIKP